jgi:hypothetical protein
MKASQVKTTPASQFDTPMEPCAICGEECRPFGYINKGKGQVCSKSCDEEYHRIRSRRWLRKKLHAVE